MYKQEQGNTNERKKFKLLTKVSMHDPLPEHCSQRTVAPDIVGALGGKGQILHVSLLTIASWLKQVLVYSLLFLFSTNQYP
jgi:hypothetical protein